MKRYSLLSLFLLTLILPAFTAETFTNEKYPNLVFTVLDADAKTVSVKAVDKTSYTASDVLDIPSLVQDPSSGVTYKVTTIAASGFNGIAIKKVVIPASVKTIGTQALRDITTSFTIELNEGLEEIGNRAFCKSFGLSGTVTIPSTVVKIAEAAFYQCTKIDTVKLIGETPPAVSTQVLDAFYAVDAVFLVPCNTILVFSADDYWGAKNLTDPCALYFIEGLQYQILNKTSAVVVGYNSEIITTTVNIPSTITVNDAQYQVTGIAKEVFKDNTTIVEVHIPSSVKTVGNSAFRNCTNLATLTLKEGVESIGDFAFYQTAISSLDCPSTIKTLGFAAFKSCSQLKKLTLNEGLTAISDSCFARTIIDTLRTPTTLEKIGLYSFRDNSNMKSVILNEGLVTIGSRSFTKNYNIKGTLTIPSTVTNIGTAAFHSCSKIDTIKMLPYEAPSVKIGTTSDSIFFGNYTADIVIPCGAMDSYTAADYWKDLSEQFVTACKPLVIHDGEALTNDTIVSEIQYKRVFNDELWQVLYLPFAVEKVTIYDEEDEQDYKLSPWNSTSGGHYYLAEYTGFSNNCPVYEVATNLEEGKYYLIKFLDKGYYHGKDIVFTSEKGEKGELHLTNSFSATSKSSSYQMCGNNTLFKQSVGDGFLFSKQDTDFIYTQNAEILPFEYYVVPLLPGNSVSSPSRLSARIGRQVDTPTNIRQTSTGAIYLYNGEQLTLYPQKKEMYIYAVNGMLLHHIPAGQTESSVNLQSGAYIIVSGNNSQKILL